METFTVVLNFMAEYRNINPMANSHAGFIPKAASGGEVILVFTSTKKTNSVSLFQVCQKTIRVPFIIFKFTIKKVNWYILKDMKAIMQVIGTI